MIAVPSKPVPLIPFFSSRTSEGRNWGKPAGKTAELSYIFFTPDYQ